MANPNRRHGSSGYESARTGPDTGLLAPPNGASSHGENLNPAEGEQRPDPSPPAPSAAGSSPPSGGAPVAAPTKPKRRLMSTALQFMASIERRLEQFDPRTQKRILEWFRSTPDPEAPDAGQA